MPPRVDRGYEEADLDLRGGPDRKQVANLPRPTKRFSRARQRRILLIHGCNTSEAHGQMAMLPVRDALVQRCEGLKGQVLTVTWPGNLDWQSGGILAYWKMVPIADLAGSELWKFLLDEYRHNEGAAELVIVAHSLGCRLVLRMIEALAATGKPQPLGKIVLVLLAAAVPVDETDLIAAAKNTADEIAVLHSERDRALSLFFPPGETAAGSGWLPEAVGLRGEPRPWSFEQRMPRDGHPGYDHEDYWKGPETVDVLAARLQVHFPELEFRKDLDRENRVPLTDTLAATQVLAMYGSGTMFG